MISDEERREVARRLRELDDSELQVYDMTYFAIQSAVGCEGDQCPDGRKLVDRLADLIEPGEPKVKCVAEVKVDGERLEELVHDAAIELTGIDRDALLALADRMETMAGTGALLTADGLEMAAVSIREALGVCCED